MLCLPRVYILSTNNLSFRTQYRPAPSPVTPAHLSSCEDLYFPPTSTTPCAARHPWVLGSPAYQFCPAHSSTFKLQFKYLPSPCQDCPSSCLCPAPSVSVVIYLILCYKLLFPRSHRAAGHQARSRYSMNQCFLNLEREGWWGTVSLKGLLPWAKTSLSMGPVSETKVCLHSSRRT